LRTRWGRDWRRSKPVKREYGRGKVLSAKAWFRQLWTALCICYRSKFRMKKIVFVAIFALATLAGAQEHSPKQRHWQLTDSETLWIGRYSNCQYSYYLLLPEAVVAHAERPPSPHHGFLINLPNVGLKTEVSMDNSDRFLWVKCRIQRFRRINTERNKRLLRRLDEQGQRQSQASRATSNEVAVCPCD
jgi:hypothetical protein